MRQVHIALRISLLCIATALLGYKFSFFHAIFSYEAWNYIESTRMQVLLHSVEMEVINAKSHILSEILWRVSEY